MLDDTGGKAAQAEVPQAQRWAPFRDNVPARGQCDQQRARGLCDRGPEHLGVEAAGVRAEQVEQDLRTCGEECVCGGDRCERKQDRACRLETPDEQRR